MMTSSIIKQASVELNAGLYVVATPIGHSGDITLRALHVLNHASVIACEDTRRTKRLLSIHGIATPCTIYHQHNASRVIKNLLERMSQGDAIALVSDAGMPTISDPGRCLIDACHAAGIACTVIAGASAITTALAASGLAADVFYFAGFAPRKQGARKQWLTRLSHYDGALVLFESPHRLLACLADCATIFPTRQAAVGREMTKKHEDIKRGLLSDLHAHYHNYERIRGECTIVISGKEHGGA